MTALSWVPGTDRAYDGQPTDTDRFCGGDGDDKVDAKDGDNNDDFYGGGGLDFWIDRDGGDQYFSGSCPF